MRLTTKGRYAVTAMLDLAVHGDGALVSLSDIAARQGISRLYLEQLFSRLRRDGLVDSSRGPGGGYRLASPVQDITLADIITSVGEGLDNSQCVGNGNCLHGERCLTHEIWHELNLHVYGFLQQRTLADMLASSEVKAVAARQRQASEVVTAPETQ